VAEGVETPQQLEFIRANGADAFQGYLFARPVSAAEFGAMLTAQPRRVAATAGLEAISAL
jgi:EAL domain-containing protein (putative c-di-GMP-specific phosphodiesterase class I)